MYQAQEDVFYYLTLMNEKWEHPGLSTGTEQGILEGMYPLRESPLNPARCKVQLFGSGAILREVLAAAELLEKDFGIGADVWSVTSYSELRRDGLEVERWNRLHPMSAPRPCYVETAMQERPGPVIAATDYMKIVAEQIRPFLGDRSFTSLGTDGFGRSDTRAALRRHFEVDRQHIALAALTALVNEERIPKSVAAEAIVRFGIDPEAASAAST